MPETLRLDRFLTVRLHRVTRLSDREIGTAYLDELGLNLGEARCLVAIGAFAPLSLNDLARTANQDKGHASRSAQALVDRGLVSKASSPVDGRGVVLELTRTGKTTYRRAVQLLARCNDASFASLSASERRVLGDLLDRVARHLLGEAVDPPRGRPPR